MDETTEKESSHDVRVTLQDIHDRLLRIEQRLQWHFTEEHKDFAAIVTWFNGLKIARVLLIWSVGFAIAVTGAWTWVKANLPNLLK